MTYRELGVIEIRAVLRRFACARCRGAVRICRSCDRGNIYCPVCAPVARRERLKRAGAHYQRSESGRANHRRRQQEYLARAEAPEKMTHRGSAARRESRHSPPRTADDLPERVPDRPPPRAPRHRGPARCDFCGQAIRAAWPQRGGRSGDGGGGAAAAPARPLHATAAIGPRGVTGRG